MRLTLRTLLAYMDGLLEPEDAQDIAKKVEESEYATNLMHRIRDCVRRLRLGAPSLSETGPNLDPNTVAEYLDNTLADDRVPDFEKVCLESDVHLAEVAACHQVLAMVLGEPAEVDEALRQRVYGLRERSAGGEGQPMEPSPEPHLPVAAETGIDLITGAEIPAAERRAPPIHVEPPRVRTKRAVPEYLREPRRRNFVVPAIVALALLVALAIGGLAATHQFDVGTPIGNWLRGTPAQIAQTAPEAVVSKADATPAQPPESAASTTAPPESVTPSTAPIEAAPPAGGLAPPSPGPSTGMASQSGSDLGPTAPSTAISGRTLPGGGLDTASAPAAASPAAPELPATPFAPPAGSPSSSLPSAAATAPPAVPGPEPTGNGSSGQPFGGGMPSAAPPPVASITPAGPFAPSAIPPLPTTGNTPGGDAAASPSATATSFPPDGAATPPAADAQLVAPTQDRGPETATPIGRLMSDRQVLLRWDHEANAWMRVASKSILLSDSELLALPGFHPEIALSNGVTLQLSGPTRLQLENRNGDVLVRVPRGRVSIAPVAQPQTKLEIEAGPAAGLLTFVQADSAATLDVLPKLAPGSDPEATPPQADALLRSTSGEITWQPRGRAESVTLPPAAMLALTAPGVLSPVPSQPPARLIFDGGTLDTRAAGIIEQSLSNDAGVETKLLELADHRQKEVRWLAIRCLAILDRFEAAVAAINSPDLRLEWDNYVELLKNTVAGGPKTAAAVRSALERQYAADEPTLYRMLWGYSPQNLEEGDDSKLVAALDSDLLAERVLALWNLNALTGMKLYFYPERTKAQRAQPLERWRQRLAAGEIRVRPTDSGSRAAPAAEPATSEPAAAPRP